MIEKRFRNEENYGNSIINNHIKKKKFINRSANESINGLTNRSTNRSTNGSTNRLTNRLTNISNNGSTNRLTNRSYTGMLNRSNSFFSFFSLSCFFFHSKSVSVT